MRQIQQLTQVLNSILTQVLRIKQHGHVEEIVAYTNKVLNGQFGFDLAELTTIIDEKSIPAFKNEIGFTNDHLNILADILYELADNGFNNPENHNESLTLFAKSLQLYEFIEHDERIYSIDRNLRITKIKDFLN